MQDLQIAYIYGNPNAVGSKERMNGLCSKKDLVRADQMENSGGNQKRRANIEEIPKVSHILFYKFFFIHIVRFY